MKTSGLLAGRTIVLLALFMTSPVSAQGVAAQRKIVPIPAPGPTVELARPAPPIQSPSIATAKAGMPQVINAKVPNVVGLEQDVAANILHAAGYKFRMTYMDQPDPSMPPGSVSATIPPAGTIQVGGTVEIRIPRVASMVGIGALSLSDLVRRDGFDLDQGRYAEVFRGADIVLRHRDDRPYTQSDGRTAYGGNGNFIEHSDNALLVKLDMFGRDFGSNLGSYQYYSACQDAMKDANRTHTWPGNDGIKVDGENATFCVLTSQHQVSVVEFRSEDNPISNKITDYKFRHALFPTQFRWSTVMDPVRAPLPH